MEARTPCACAACPAPWMRPSAAAARAASHTARGCSDLPRLAEHGGGHTKSSQNRRHAADPADSTHQLRTKKAKPCRACAYGQKRKRHGRKCLPRTARRARLPRSKYARGTGPPRSTRRSYLVFSRCGPGAQSSASRLSGAVIHRANAPAAIVHKRIKSARAFTTKANSYYTLQRADDDSRLKRIRQTRSRKTHATNSQPHTKLGPIILLRGIESAVCT
jgi:hypothetical protein